MSSSDDSFDSSSDFETAETEEECDLEVEVMSNASEQKDTSDDDKPEDLFANEQTRIGLLNMRQKEKKEQELEEKLCPEYALSLVWSVVASKKTTHLSGFPFFLQKHSYFLAF